MTIIFSNHLDEDSRIIRESLHCLYNANLIEILPDTDNYEEIVDNAISNEDDTLLLIGHGSTYGLLHPNFDICAYLIHENNIHLIQARRVICLWCYAYDFCSNNNFHSFATSMFISNCEEAYTNCIYDISQDYINSTDRQIYMEIMDLINNNTPLKEWVMCIGSKIDVENPIDSFNRQGLMLID